MTIAREPRLVAMPSAHPLADRSSVRFDEIRDEPFLALPQSAGPLREYWLAGATNVAAEINDTEETYEAVAAGIGVYLLAAGNAPIFARGEVTMLGHRPQPGRARARVARAPLPAAAGALREPRRRGLSEPAPVVSRA